MIKGIFDTQNYQNIIDLLRIKHKDDQETLNSLNVLSEFIHHSITYYEILIDDIIEELAKQGITLNPELKKELEEATSIATFTSAKNNMTIDAMEMEVN